MVESNISQDESFGIIPILRQNDAYSFLLIQHQAGHWGFPKGHAIAGESPVQAARRELGEETGIYDYNLLEGVSFSEQYTFTRKGKSFDKTVTYFLAWVESPIVHCQIEEIQNYTWADFETAIALITYAPCKQIMREVNQYLTTAIIRDKLSKRGLKIMLSERFTEALIYATQLHANQVRKGSGVPYVAHLLGVASIALEYGANEEEAIASLLHDAIEDQGGAATREEIRRRFGDTVTAIVDGCTDSETIPKPPWRQRKEAYLAHIPTAAPSVLLVSASDKLHNARSILKDYRELGESVWERFKGGREGSLWYYRALVEAFRQVWSSPLIDELHRVVSELEQLARGV